MKNSSESTYLLRYAGAGLVNAITGLGTIALLTYLNVHPVIANVSGFAIGIIFSFTLAKFFVFKRRNNTKSQMQRYALAFTIAYGLNIITLLLLKGLVHAAIAQALAISVYVVFMYALMRLYIFPDN